MAEVDRQEWTVKSGFDWSSRQKSGKIYGQFRLVVANVVAAHVDDAKGEVVVEEEGAVDAYGAGADLGGDTLANEAEEVAWELGHRRDAHVEQEGRRDRIGSAFPLAQAPTCASEQIRALLDRA